jgi:hypothetical protein
LGITDQRGRTESKEREKRVTPVHSNPVKRRSHRLDAQRDVASLIMTENTPSLAHPDAQHTL